MVNIGKKEVPGLIRNGAYCLEKSVSFVCGGMDIIREIIAWFFFFFRFKINRFLKIDK